jgi:hypothetical protein
MSYENLLSDLKYIGRKEIEDEEEYAKFMKN